MLVVTADVEIADIPTAVPALVLNVQAGVVGIEAPKVIVQAVAAVIPVI